jgi:beta-lactamase regulating signal transducer with metallopeptidase domain
MALSGRRGKGGPAIVDGVPVVVTEALGPATVGVWRTHVLLPKWVLGLPDTQRNYVVRHEEEHRRAHDGQLLFVASLLLIVVPWNVALWWQLRRLSLAIEMDCDNRVVRALGNAPAYGNLLLTIAQAANGGPRLQPALLGGVGALEQRLTRLLAPTPLRFAQRMLFSVAIGALLLLVLSMPHPVRPSHVHATATTSAAHSR